jgi:hypothetical protein
MAKYASMWKRVGHSIAANPGRFAAGSAVVGTFCVLASTRAQDDAQLAAAADDTRRTSGAQLGRPAKSSDGGN